MPLGSQPLKSPTGWGTSKGQRGEAAVGAPESPAPLFPHSTWWGLQQLLCFQAPCRSFQERVGNQVEGAGAGGWGAERRPEEGRPEVNDPGGYLGSLCTQSLVCKVG